MGEAIKATIWDKNTIAKQKLGPGFDINKDLTKSSVGTSSAFQHATSIKTKRKHASENQKIRTFVAARRQKDTE